MMLMIVDDLLMVFSFDDFWGIHATSPNHHAIYFTHDPIISGYIPMMVYSMYLKKKKKTL